MTDFIEDTTTKECLILMGLTVLGCVVTVPAYCWYLTNFGINC